MPDQKPSLEATLLQKAQGIGPDPNPVRQESAMSKILELLTGYPSDPEEPVGPATMLMAAAPIVGAVGKSEKLATDYASRMQRAKDMGFAHDVYHGTRDKWGIPHNVQPGNIKEFKYINAPYGDAGIHVDPDPKVAAKATQMGTSVSDLDYPYKATVIPLKARINNPLSLPDMTIWKDPDKWKRTMEHVMNAPSSPNLKPVDLELYNAATDYAAKMRQWPKTGDAQAYMEKTQEQWANTFKNILKRHGHDAIRYSNKIEGRLLPGGESKSYMLLDPNQLRSRNALFDPARAKSGDLLASILAGIGLGGAAVSDKDK